MEKDAVPKDDWTAGSKQEGDRPMPSKHFLGMEEDTFWLHGAEPWLSTILHDGDFLDIVVEPMSAEPRDVVATPEVARAESRAGHGGGRSVAEQPDGDGEQQGEGEREAPSGGPEGLRW